MFTAILETFTQVIYTFNLSFIDSQNSFIFMEIPSVFCFKLHAKLNKRSWKYILPECQIGNGYFIKTGIKNPIDILVELNAR